MGVRVADGAAAVRSITGGTGITRRTVRTGGTVALVVAESGVTVRAALPHRAVPAVPQTQVTCRQDTQMTHVSESNLESTHRSVSCRTDSLLRGECDGSHDPNDRHK